MAENFYSILTAVGLAKIANAQVSGNKVNLTQIAVGDGGGTYYNPTQNDIQLRNEVWRGNIGSVEIDPENPNWIVIESYIPATQGGFTVREVGIFDDAGDLIAIGKYPETYKPSLDDGATKDLLLRMIIEVTNASAVTMKVDPSVIIASRKYVDEKVGVVSDNLTQLDNKVMSHLAEFETLLSQNAIMHNNIYRGKYLGDSVTPAQYQAISSGTFEDLYIGDYWTIGGVNYRIAAFDYYYNTGDTACTTHHAVIVPDSILYTHPMNDTGTTEGGYVNSKMYTEGLAQAKTTIESAFSGHVLNHRQLLSNATSGGKASGWAWFDSVVELMTETMVYGSVVWGESAIGGSGYNIGVGKSQLPLFQLNPRMINTRQSYWLRDVVSSSYFAIASNTGFASNDGASAAFGVRPAFSIS